MRSSLKNLIFSAIMLAAALLLPLLTANIQQLGNMLCPMHIPVFICGFICGWKWGLGVGALAPILRFAIFGMPPIFPTGAAMALELAAYAAAAALIYSALPKKPWAIYVSLICAMIAGRIVWGAIYSVFTSLAGIEFTFAMYLAAAFVNALPGMALHIAIIPPIVLALRKISA